MRSINHGNKLPREKVDLVSFDDVRSKLNAFLDNGL